MKLGSNPSTTLWAFPLVTQLTHLEGGQSGCTYLTESVWRVHKLTCINPDTQSLEMCSPCSSTRLGAPWGRDHVCFVPWRVPCVITMPCDRSWWTHAPWCVVRVPIAQRSGAHWWLPCGRATMLCFQVLSMHVCLSSLGTSAALGPTPPFSLVPLCSGDHRYV